MWLPTSAQTPSSTHWPSWSQAPSLWGSPKSPATIGPVDRGDDLGQGDALGRPRQHVAPAHAALGAHEADALQAQEDLFEVRLGQSGSLGEVAHRGRHRQVRAEGEAQQRSAGVVAPGRNSHRFTLPSRGLENPGHARPRVIVWHSGRVEDAPNENVTVDPDEVLAPGQDEVPAQEENSDYISQPAKVMRIGSMVKSLLDEARGAPLDEAGRARLREIYDISITRALGRPVAGPRRRTLDDGACPSAPTCRPSPSCASPRPSSSAGSKGSSTASRPRSSPSRPPRPPSSRRCAIDRCRPGAGEPRAGTYL